MSRNIRALETNIFHIQRTFYLIDSLWAQQFADTVFCFMTFVHWDS